jgi:hypothetical protein
MMENSNERVSAVKINKKNESNSFLSGKTKIIKLSKIIMKQLCHLKIIKSFYLH